VTVADDVAARVALVVVVRESAGFFAGCERADLSRASPALAVTDDRPAAS
jgi:hypothetical protein